MIQIRFKDLPNECKKGLAEFYKCKSDEMCQTLVYFLQPYDFKNFYVDNVNSFASKDFVYHVDSKNIYSNIPNYQNVKEYIRNLKLEEILK